VRKKETTWITSREAARILTKKSGRPVNDRYIRRLAVSGKIDSQEITPRQKLYSKEDIEGYTLSERVGAQEKKEKAVA